MKLTIWDQFLFYDYEIRSCGTSVCNCVYLQFDNMLRLVYQPIWQYHIAMHSRHCSFICRGLLYWSTTYLTDNRILGLVYSFLPQNSDYPQCIFPFHWLLINVPTRLRVALNFPESDWCIQDMATHKFLQSLCHLSQITRHNSTRYCTHRDFIGF